MTARNGPAPTMESELRASNLGDGQIASHPAFGQIAAHRVSGGAILYGSDFRRNGYVGVRDDMKLSHQ